MDRSQVDGSERRHQSLVIEGIATGAIRLLPMRLRRRLLYRHYVGRWPSLRNPQSMTEKINWRIAKDRRPILAWTCDKLAMKRWVARHFPDVRIPVVLWQGTDVADLIGGSLPDRWVLKPNHRSELVYFGSGSLVDVTSIADVTRNWLEEANNKGNGEWAYGQAERTMLVEEALGEPGSPPTDYKFYVFDGVVRLIQVEVDRFGGGHARAHFDADWQPVELAVALPTSHCLPRPSSLDRMLEIARRIGAPFDFMRIDLYDVDGEVFFGEVTPYPASGFSRYEPPSMDFVMGEFWKLPSKV